MKTQQTESVKLLLRWGWWVCWRASNWNRKVSLLEDRHSRQWSIAALNIIIFSFNGQSRGTSWACWKEWCPCLKFPFSQWSSVWRPGERWILRNMMSFETQTEYNNPSWFQWRTMNVLPSQWWENGDTCELEYILHLGVGTLHGYL